MAPLPHQPIASDNTSARPGPEPRSVSVISETAASVTNQERSIPENDPTQKQIEVVTVSPQNKVEVDAIPSHKQVEVETAPPQKPDGAATTQQAPAQSGEQKVDTTVLEDTPEAESAEKAKHDTDHETITPATDSPVKKSEAPRDFEEKISIMYDAGGEKEVVMGSATPSGGDSDVEYVMSSTAYPGQWQEPAEYFGQGWN